MSKEFRTSCKLEKFMLYTIYCIDIENSKFIRDKFYPEHKSFLSKTDRYGIDIIMSGPLMNDRNDDAIGSLFVIDAADRLSAEEFHHNDPFYKAGVWQKTYITSFIRRR